MADSLADTLQRMLDPVYRIEREIAGGGMSRLFLATELRLDRQVVAKVLPPDLVSKASIRRFRREIEVTVRLQHPHILPVLTAGGDDDVLYYVTPYVAGESLRDRILREGRLPAADARRILGQVADALAFAHARGVVHRDVKPGNILLLEGHAVLADFGIAHAVDGTGDPLTTSDGRPGTPPYMAPEPSRDHQADLYALAVVGHEMLTGVRPAGSVSAADILAAARTGERQGPSVDAEIVAAVAARGLARRPEDRFPTATEMHAAIVGTAVPGPSAPRSLAPTRHRDVVRRVVRRGAAVALALVAVVAAGAYLRRASVSINRPASLSPDLYLVLPFGARRASGPRGPAGDLVAEHVERALREWRGLATVEAARVAERMEGRDVSSLRLTDARMLAAGLGAGRLVWGDVSTAEGAVRVEATLYDLTNPARPPRTHRVEYHADSTGTSAVDAYRRLVTGLLRDGDRLPWRDAADQRPASLDAWSAYDVGAAALRRWDLGAAVVALRRAVALEPEHAPAHLALARALTYDGTDTTRAVLRTSARRARELATRLTEEEALLATGLLSLAESRHPEACAAFRRLVQRDSGSFDGWYGLGECQRRDTVVVRGARTASGHAFRGSYEAAASAYERALATLPGAPPAFPFVRLQRVLFTETNRLRTGYRAGGEHPLRAYPSLDHDTLAFIPFEARPGAVVPVPTTRLAAVEDNIHRLWQAIAGWARLAPTSVEAHLALAEALEAMGHVSEGGADDMTALAAIRRARALARDTSLRATGIQVRLLLKDGDYAGARALADSALARAPDPEPGAAVTLAGLAALTGRTARVAELLRELSAAPRFLPPTYSPPTRSVLPPELRRARAELLAFAATGACGEPLRELPRRIERLVAEHVPDVADRRILRDALLERPLSLAVPCLGTAPTLSIARPTDRLVRLQQAVARGDRRAFRAHLDSLSDTRRFGRAADVTFDYAFAEAWLLAAVGDTSAALSRLDRSLDALPLMSPSAVLQVPVAAGLVHAMALAARLSGRSSDDRSARRWASAVVTLWSDADAELQPLVAEMRTLSAVAARVAPAARGR